MTSARVRNAQLRRHIVSWTKSVRVNVQIAKVYVLKLDDLASAEQCIESAKSSLSYLEATVAEMKVLKTNPELA
jgi:ribosome-binding factor A